MTTLPTTLIGEFIDASVRDQDKAAELLAGRVGVGSGSSIRNRTWDAPRVTGKARRRGPRL